MNRRRIMKEAWLLAEIAVMKFGGRKIDYISQALKNAWAEAKKSAKEILLTEGGKAETKIYIQMLADLGIGYGEKSAEEVVTPLMWAVKKFGGKVLVNVGIADRVFYAKNRFSEARKVVLGL